MLVDQDGGPVPKHEPLLRGIPPTAGETEMLAAGWGAQAGEGDDWTGGVGRAQATPPQRATQLAPAQKATMTASGPSAESTPCNPPAWNSTPNVDCATVAA